MSDMIHEMIHVDLPTIIFRCSRIDGGPEVQEALTKLSAKEIAGVAFLTPVTQTGNRNQEMHCLLLTYGGTSKYSSLGKALEFVKANFVSSLFIVEHYSHIQGACLPSTTT